VWRGPEGLQLICIPLGGEPTSELSLQRIAELLLSAGEKNGHLPPTLLYNEGWLLRLVLDWFSRSSITGHPLTFAAGSTWYTEALLPTQFRARSRGDKLAESRTHADGVIGHVRVGGEGKGDLALDRAARQFVVVEAKLFSALSAGTKRALEYDQAARNLACMAHVVAEANVPLQQLEALHFLVLAPAEQIDRNVFGNRVSRESAQIRIEERAAAYAGAKDLWCEQVMRPFLAAIQPQLLSWEEILEAIAQVDARFGPALTSFYLRCLEFNRPRFRRAAT
jgi:hypothetical protein